MCTKPFSQTKKKGILFLAAKSKSKSRLARMSLKYLDQEVTEQEIRQAVKKLKNKKSPLVDKIRNKMIKASLGSLVPIYIKLFNFILQSGKMPDIWCQGLITPIYKSGDKSDHIQQTIERYVYLVALENCCVLF